jgi:hypothetical protein
MTEARQQSSWARRAALTEQDWLSCPDPRPMLPFVQGRVSERKRGCFALGLLLAREQILPAGPGPDRRGA